MAKLTEKFSVYTPFEIVVSGGRLVRQVDVNGVALDDSSVSYSVATPVMPVDANGVNEDASKTFSVHMKVTISPKGHPIVRVDVNGVAISTSLSGTIPTITTVPVITGDPVVGQVLFSSNGVWAGSPTSYAFQWYNTNGIITGATDDTYLINDIDAGLTFYCQVTAINGAGSSTPASSLTTAAVALIDLTTAVTAFSRTSSSGTTPMVWSLAFGTKVYAGYMLRMQVFTNSTMLDAERQQDVHYRLTNDDLVPGVNLQATLAAAGLTDPTATQWLFPTVYTQSPNGLGFLGSATDPISPTDAAVPMTWSSSDHKSGMILSGANQTIGVGSAGTWAGARTNRGIGAGLKVYVEMSGNLYAGVADAAASLTDAHGGAPGDGTATIHAAEYQPFNQLVFFNSTSVGTPTAGNTSFVIGITLDTTGANPVATFYYNNVLQGSRTLTGISSPLFFMTTMANGQSTTINPGTTPGGTAGFAFTPPAGFVSP